MKPDSRSMLNQLPDQLCAEFPGAAGPPAPITVARIGLEVCGEVWYLDFGGEEDRT